MKKNIMFIVGILILILCVVSSCKEPEPFYIITYNLEGGVNSEHNVTTYSESSSNIILSDPTRDGYSFEGWFNNPEFSGSEILSIPSGSIGNIILYASWNANTYEVTFDPQGGENLSVATKAVIFDSAYGELATLTFNEEGYEFGGWFTIPDGEGDRITDVSIVGIGENHTLYAYKAPIEYTITYNLDGGENNETNPDTYTIESATINLADPQKEGYSFLGWFDNQELTGSAIEEIPSASTGNLNLYSSWNPNTYTITFESNGGTVATPLDKEVVFNEMYGELAVSTKEGYDFIGWYTAIGDTGTIVQTDTMMSIDQDHTLYARWEAHVYTLTFNSTGGTVTDPPTQNITYNSEYGLLPSPTKEGYIFEGWYTEINEGTKIDSDSIVTIASDDTLYAHWALANYTITYHLDSGINDEDNPATYTIETATISLEEATKEGYTFDGWFDNTSFSGSAITHITVGSTGNKNLYAKWTPITYTITYFLDDGTNDVDNPATYTIETATISLVDPIKEGYTFGGWFDNASFSGTAVTHITVGSTGNRTLYAKWTPTVYTITYLLDSGINDEDNPPTYTIETETISLEEAVKEGYTFDGWFDNASFSGTAVTQITVGSTGNMTLYAKWTPIIYTITYSLNGGINDVDNPATYTIETATISLVDPIKEGYTFGGWFNNAELSGTAVTHITVGSTGNRTLYAKWTPTIYTITYLLDDGINDEDNPATYTIETTTISLEEATKEGYTFDGWFDNASFSGTAVTHITVGSTGNKNLYAKWTPITYTITYTLNGGINDVDNPATYTILSDIPIKEATRDYYHFNGWYANEDFSGEVVDHIYSGTISNKHFYAKWTPIEYSITYQLNGGTNNAENPSTFTIESSEIEFENPTKSGFYFAGWFEESTFDTMITAIPSESHTPYTVYAKWNQTYNLRDIGPEGGTVFYEKIDYDYRTDTWRYLECAGFDVGNFAWIETSSFEPYVVEVEGTSVLIGTGRENSDLMLIAAFEASNRNSAANACDDYPESDSGVWFLPSRDELSKIHKNLKLEGVGNFSSVNYWSSSQISETDAWSVDFGDGSIDISAKGNSLAVRPIRRF